MPNDYLSFLMGAPELTDDELAALGVEIVERRGRSVRCLRIPASALEAYLELVAGKLEPTYWNEVIGENDIRFVFKLADGSVRRLTLGPDTEAEIAALCAELNEVPLEQTRNVLRYLATNTFYKDALARWYGVAAEAG
ncbi:MAG: hypothetical protein BAA04_06535 [Firmicutes bacterium ZCTH02-B6]|nr:MAG: hypothetical protein BAA04_06535 [Firmicutes bacterium ZCTH02-B6]